MLRHSHYVCSRRNVSYTIAADRHFTTTRDLRKGRNHEEVIGEAVLPPIRDLLCSNILGHLIIIHHQFV